MTWQLGSAVVLIGALAAGFAWYERSRPPARVLALVAALAALAAIGRVAFAAFPNVKPTTDIVLFSGYALGGPAGFAAGAVAALVSNVFLGQGPWTPWQMAAWGLVGLGGAGLGRMLRGREPGRFSLAVVCGVAGLAFGALMDVYQWSLAAEHTLSTYLAVSGTSLTFNIAHAVGNIVFALLIGPAFIRSLARYRRRFEVRWLPSPAAAGIVSLALCLCALQLGFGGVHEARAAVSAAPPADVAPSIARAVRYLRFAQNPDGGFGAAVDQSSTSLHTGWTALGLASAGRNPRDVDQRRHSAIDYIAAHTGSLGDVGELERTLLVLRAAGMRPVLGGRNLLARLIAKQHGDGAFDTLNHTAFGILALRAGGRTPRSKEVRAAAHWLLHSQNPDGGFGFSRGAATDVDDTGAALEALAAAGHGRSPVAARAVRYLRRAQRPDGGFGQMAAATSNAQSTAWAVQGIVAAGHDPRKLRRARNPLQYLESLQAGDGSVRYSRTSTQTPVWVTAQALVALEGKAFPLRPAPRHKAYATAAAARPVRERAQHATTQGARSTRGRRVRPARATRAAHSRRPAAHAAAGSSRPAGGGATATPTGAGSEIVLHTRPAAARVSQPGHGSGSIVAAVVAALAAAAAYAGLRRVAGPI